MGNVFIKFSWNYSRHEEAEIKDKKQEELLSLQVMQQLNWKYYKKNTKNTHTSIFLSSCGMIPKDMKAKPFNALLLIMTVKNAFVPFSQEKYIFQYY